MRKKKSELEMIVMKISAKDLRRIKALAKKYADGNLSAWLRSAGLEYIPTKPLDPSQIVYR
jgi:hypothetical protein